MDHKYIVEKTQIESAYGTFDFFCFSWGEHEEDNILCLANLSYNDVPFVRIQSACYTAEIFRSLDCDCHAQLHRSQKMIADKGGILIYMLCDGRGAGLLNKIKGLEMGRKDGIDTSDAYRKMGLQQDPRDYTRAIEILSYFKLKEINLLTNNPRKVSDINKAVVVNRVPLEVASTDKSNNYLKTKAEKMGHHLSEFQNPE